MTALKWHEHPPSGIRGDKEEALIELAKKKNLLLGEISDMRKPIALISCEKSDFVVKARQALSECADVDILEANSAYETGKMVIGLQPAILILSDNLICLTDKNAVGKIISDVTEHTLIIIGVGSREITSHEIFELEGSHIDAYLAISVPIEELKNRLSNILRRKGLAGRSGEYS